MTPRTPFPPGFLFPIGGGIGVWTRGAETPFQSKFRFIIILGYRTSFTFVLINFFIGLEITSKLLQQKLKCCCVYYRFGRGGGGVELCELIAEESDWNVLSMYDKYICLGRGKYYTGSWLTYLREWDNIKAVVWWRTLQKLYHIEPHRRDITTKYGRSEQTFHSIRRNTFRHWRKLPDGQLLNGVTT